MTIKAGSDIVSIVNSNPAGTTYVIAAGLYRLSGPIAPKKGDIFIGQTACAPPKTACPAILSGARLLTSFKHSGSYYSVSGQTQQNNIYITTKQCQTPYPGCLYPEDLFFDSKPLLHVTSLAEVVSGTWFFDYANKTIYFYDNPTGHTVETSTVSSAFQSMANNVTIKQLTLEKFASPVTRGAIGFTGNPSPSQGVNWLVQNNEVRFSHGDGVRMNYSYRILNNFIHDNGNLGIGGGPTTGVLVQGNEISYNNYAHVLPQFGAGGVKINQTTGFILRNNYIHNNEGSGFHADTDNYNTLAEGNTITDNTEQGLFNEISYAATFRNNVLARNGYIHPNASDWLYAANILSSTSQSVQAYCNTVQVSDQGGNGINIIEQPRAGYVSKGNYFHHNTVIFSGASGWSGAANATTDPTFYANNHLDFNRYHAQDLTRRAFPYQKVVNTFTQFKAEGAEPHGAADTNYLASTPVVTISSPGESTNLSGVVAVTGTASDKAGIGKIEFYVDWALKATSSGTSPFTFEWNTTGLAAGSHMLTAMAYNTSGVSTCFAIPVTLP